MMVQTTITPQKSNFNMKVSLPSEYVGKPVRVSFYLEEEAPKSAISLKDSYKPSDFFGTLSEEEGNRMHQYLTQSRNEE